MRPSLQGVFVQELGRLRLGDGALGEGAQAEPAADARLRDVLQIATCNAVEVDVFNKADW